MLMIKIVWNWIVRQFMSFVRFALKQELDQQKKEFESAKEESDNAVNDFESEFSKYKSGK